MPKPDETPIDKVEIESLIKQVKGETDSLDNKYRESFARPASLLDDLPSSEKNISIDDMRKLDKDFFIQLL